MRTYFLLFCFLAPLSLLAAAPTAKSIEEELLQGEIFRVVLAPRHRTKLNTQVFSPVVKINKRFGESFVAGEPLIELDSTIYAATLERQKANFKKAKIDLEAMRKLYADGGASLFDLQNAENALATARAEVVIARKNVDFTKINAPYNGKVVNVSIDIGETPFEGKELIEIVDESVLIAKLIVPSTLLSKLNIGDTVSITLRDTGAKLTAKITRFDAVIDPSSSTIKIEAEIDNSAGLYKAGMSGVAAFKSADNARSTP